MGEVLHQYENERRAGDRRVRRVSLVLHERRSGFDRRARPGNRGTVPGLTGVLLAVRDRPGILWIILVSVNALNLADFLLTLNILALGGGEANPLLAHLFAADPFYAGLFKFTVVLLVTLAVWRCRRFRRALEASFIMLGVFTVVFFYHIYGLVLYG